MRLFVRFYHFLCGRIAILTDCRVLRNKIIDRSTQKVVEPFVKKKYTFTGQ